MEVGIAHLSVSAIPRRPCKIHGRKLLTIKLFQCVTLRTAHICWNQSRRSLSFYQNRKFAPFPEISLSWNCSVPKIFIRKQCTLLFSRVRSLDSRTRFVNVYEAKWSWQYNLFSKVFRVDRFLFNNGIMTDTFSNFHRCLISSKNAFSNSLKVWPGDYENLSALLCRLVNYTSHLQQFLHL